MPFTYNMSPETNYLYFCLIAFYLQYVSKKSIYISPKMLKKPNWAHRIEVLMYKENSNDLQLYTKEGLHIKVYSGHSVIYLLFGL